MRKKSVGLWRESRHIAVRPKKDKEESFFEDRCLQFLYPFADAGRDRLLLIEAPNTRNLGLCIV
jgi:hypothetical protein